MISGAHSADCPRAANCLGRGPSGRPAGPAAARRSPRARAAFVLLLAGLGAGGARAAAAPEVPTVVTSDDALIQSTDRETTSDLAGHVVVTGTNMRLTCDRMITVTTRITDKTAAIGDPTGLKSLLAIGHVHLVQNDGLREAFCGQAEVFPKEDKIVLTQEPVVVDRANGSKATGEVIELYRGQRQVKGRKVQITFPPIKDLGFDKSSPPASPPAPLPAAPSAGTPPSPAPGGAPQQP